MKKDGLFEKTMKVAKYLPEKDQQYLAKAISYHNFPKKVLVEMLAKGQQAKKLKKNYV